MRSLLLSVGVVSVLTLCSNLLGFGREMLFARAFGAEGEMDAYLVGFRIVSSVFLLLSAGALNNAFLPRFKGLCETGEESTARRLFRQMFWHLLILGLLVAALLVLFSAALVRFFAPGLSAEQVEIAARMVQILSPVVVFATLGALLKSVHNSFQRFTVPAAVPALQNLVVVLALLTIAPGAPIGVAAVAVCVSYVWWVVLLAPAGFGLTRGEQMDAGQQYRLVLFHMVPLIFLDLIDKTSGLVQTRLLSALDAGSISAIHFAGKISGLPTGLFVTAVGTVVFPSLVGAWSRDRRDEYEASSVFGMRLLMVLCAPVVVASVLYSQEVVALLFQRGEFGVDATLRTAAAFEFFIAALIPSAIYIYVMKLFYSAESYRLPLVVIGIGQSFQILFIWLSVREFGYVGVPIGNLFAAILQAAAMLAAAQRYLDVHVSRLLGTIARPSLACLAALIVDGLTADLGLALALRWCLFGVIYLVVLGLAREPVLQALVRRSDTQLPL